MRFMILLLALCGCATERVESRKPRVELPARPTMGRAAAQAVVVVPSPTIGLAWHAGQDLSTGASPRTSGIESTADFAHWFAETNVPVALERQALRVVLPVNGPYRYYRAVDRY